MRRGWIAVAWCVLAAAACGSPAQPLNSADAYHTFAAGIHSEGLRYKDAKLLVRDPASEDMLKRMLTEQGLLPSNRGTVWVLLGIIATPTASQIVFDGIKSGGGTTLTADDALARLDAVTGLGYAAYENADPAPLNLLINCLQPTGWPSQVTWKLPEGEFPAQRLRARCISALGLSGRPAAHAELITLRTQLFGVVVGPPQNSEEALVLEAIKTNEFIAAHQPDGLLKYYAQYPQ